MESFTEEEKRLYLRFVVGRTRLPANSEELRHKIAAIHNSNPDKSFPHSHTW